MPISSYVKNIGNASFWTLCIMGVLAILSSTMSKNPVLKPFASSLGAPEGFWTGFVASASTIPGIIISLPAASLSDILGRRKMLLIAGVVFASAPFLYLLIYVWWQLILVRFYHGFATAIFVPIVEASIAELFPTKRGERISLFSSASAVGRGIAPFLGGTILSVTDYGFELLYLGVGVAGVTAFILISLFVVERRNSGSQIISSRGAIKRVIHGWGTIAANRDILVVSLIQASQYYVFGAVEFFLVGYLGDVVRLDSFFIGIIMGSQMVAIILARPYFGRISDRVGRRSPIVAGSVMSGLPLLALPFSFEFPVLFFLSMLYGIGFAMVTSSTSALVSEFAPVSLVGTSMGFLGAIMDIGQTMGPPITGMILATNLAYQGSFLSLTIVLFISCIVFIVSRTSKAEQPP